MSRGGSPSVISDAGPLIGLARIGRLEILPRLFARVLIPTSVETELDMSAPRPSSLALRAASTAGWLRAMPVQGVASRVMAALDQGEAEAIALAKDESLPLLIDERRGRIVARSEGVKVFGTGALLVSAKEHRLIPNVGAELSSLIRAGYRISQKLQAEILRLAGETGSD